MQINENHEIWVQVISRTSNFQNFHISLVFGTFFLLCGIPLTAHAPVCKGCIIASEDRVAVSCKVYK